MSNKKKATGHAFGTVYLGLANTLLKAHKYAESHFSLYVSCRSNIDSWQFSETDIRTSSGISRNTVKKLCQQYSAAGIFELDGTTRNGSRKYKLNKVKYQEYAQGKKSLAEWIGVSIVDRVSTGPHTSLIGEAVNQEHEGLSAIDTPGCQPLIANNKETRKNEKKEAQTKACVCAFSHSLPAGEQQLVNGESAKAKAKAFLALVNQLTKESLDYGIRQDSNTFDQVYQFFASSPNYAVDQLFHLFEVTNSNMWWINNQHNIIDGEKNPEGLQKALDFQKACATGFDPFFYSRRSNNLAFFLKHSANVYSEMLERLEICPPHYTNEQIAAITA